MQHSHLTFFDAGGCLGLAALCQKGESTNIEENFRGLEAGGGGDWDVLLPWIFQNIEVYIQN